MTNTVKHTPGPWFAHGGIIRRVAESDGVTVAIVDGLSKEDEANASLIAAAPDMFELAKAVLGFEYCHT